MPSTYVLVLLYTIVEAQQDFAGTGLDLICTKRQCLPENKAGSEAGGAQLCYTNTGGTEAYATCKDDNAKFCTQCSTTPPCESTCEGRPFSVRQLGSSCHFDHECGGQFVACHAGICRRVLWTDQKCNAKDDNDICAFGRLQCIRGRCSGLKTNELCWDGYPGGLDLDCQTGWYCLRGRCVPQLPKDHTCLGVHSNECVRGFQCNLAPDSRRCTAEYSLPDYVRSSNQDLCMSAHIDPRTGECSRLPPYLNGGGDCRSSDDCRRLDSSKGSCACKRWWDGSGAAGFCELAVPATERPSWMKFWRLRNERCHPDWPDERCARELGELPLYKQVVHEREASADPTSVPECAADLLPGFYVGNARRPSTFLFMLAMLWLVCQAFSELL